MRNRSRSTFALWVGAILIGLVIASALLSFAWTPFDPLHAIPADRLQGPNARHWLGTDRYGRDVLSQLMVGSRITLAVGCCAVALALVAGTALGVWGGMRRGLVDKAVTRLTDTLLAFPALLLAIVTGAVFGAQTATAVLAIGIAYIPVFARVTRAGTLRVMAQDFVDAARISRLSEWRIALRHVLPNISGLIIVQASVTFALAILAEAALSFLGLGTAPPNPSWGRMLQGAQAQLWTNPELALWPGLAIACAVLGFNLLGDGLRDRLDPKNLTGRSPR